MSEEPSLSEEMRCEEVVLSKIKETMQLDHLSKTVV